MDRDRIAEVLQSAGITIVSEMDTDFIIYCPYHSNTRTPAGEVSTSDGTFYCFSCYKTSSLEELISHVVPCSIFEAMRAVRSGKSNKDILSEVNKALTINDDDVEFDHALIYRLHQDCVTTEIAMQYWYGRGLSADTIDKFNLGYSQSQNMAIIPVHSPRGMLMGFVGRSISGPKRFKNSTGMKKARTLFNLHRVKTSREVTIVESAIDAMLLDQVGVPAVASLGASLSKEQIRLLNNTFNNVILIPDSDEAGRQMTHKLEVVFGPSMTVMGLPEGVKDVGELTDEERTILSGKIEDPLRGIDI